MKILRVKQSDGTLVDIPVGVNTAGAIVDAHNINTSAHVDIREEISQLSSDKVDKTNIVQEAGNSESLVMSQKAITNLVSDALNSSSGGSGTSLYETVDSVEEMTDTSKSYVLSSTGTIWTYGEATVDDTNRNLYDASKVSLNQNPDGTTRAGAFLTDFIPVDITYTDPYIVKIEGSAAKVRTASYPNIYKVFSYNADGEEISVGYGQGTGTGNIGVWGDGLVEWHVGYYTATEKYNNYNTIASVRILFKAGDSTIDSSAVPTDIVITTPEPKTKADTAWHDTLLTPSSAGGGNHVDLLIKVNQNTTDIADVSNRVTTLETNNGSTTIPDYWNNAVNTAIAKVTALQETGGKDAVNFMWFSDFHYGGSTKYIGNIGRLCAYIMDSCHIPLALMNGDTLTAGVLATDTAVTDMLGDAMELYTPIGTDRLMLVRGNHDDVYGEYTTDNTITNYVNKVAPTKIWNSLHRLQATDFRRVFGGDGTYFYLDNNPQKVRFICLNSQFYDGEAITNGTTQAMTFAFGETQLNWFENIALNVESGWSVIIAFHTPTISDYATKFSGTDYTDFRNIIKNSSVDIIGIFCGHAHKDRVITDDLPCPIITVTCAINTPYDGTASERVVGTDKETAFDIVTINKMTKTISCTRVGVGDDRVISY
jgi:hypothetical protein